MAYIQGTVTGHLELFDVIRRYITGRPSVGTPTYSGTGDGTLDDFDGYPKCPSETWTLTATSATNFTVTGSVNGSQAAATVGTPYDNGFISFTLTAGGVAFVSSDEFTIVLTEGALTTSGIAYHELEYGTDTSDYDVSTTDHFIHVKAPGITVVPSFSGTGNGTITGITRYSYTSATAESWTITCTTAPSTFSVVGSISGAEANATVGTIYDNGKIRFLLTQGGTTFAQDDVFILGTPKEVFMSISTYQDTFADIYNLKIAGADGFLSSQLDDFDAQPNSSGGKGVPLFQNPIDYTLVVNGQRLVLAAYVENVYSVCYLGLLFPYGTPTQMPYPMCVGGMLSDASLTRYSETSNIFPFENNQNMFLRQPSGNWISTDMWPYVSTWVDGSFHAVRDTGGNYPLLPIVPFDTGQDEQYGELDGVKFVSGFDMVVDDHVVIGGDTYLVVFNWNRTDFNDYCAIKLD